MPRDPSTFPQPAPAEVLVEVSGEPDNLNRVPFAAFWATAYVPGAPELKVRGQVFYADLDRFSRRAARDGRVVRVVSHHHEAA